MCIIYIFGDKIEVCLICPSLMSAFAMYVNTYNFIALEKTDIMPNEQPRKHKWNRCMHM